MPDKSALLLPAPDQFVRSHGSAAIYNLWYFDAPASGLLSAVRCILWKDSGTVLPDNLYDSGYRIAPVLPAPILKTVPESFDPLRQTKSDIRQGQNNRAPAFSESDKLHPQPLPEDTAPTMLYNRSVLLRSRNTCSTYCRSFSLVFCPTRQILCSNRKMQTDKCVLRRTR